MRRRDRERVIRRITNPRRDLRCLIVLKAGCFDQAYYIVDDLTRGGGAFNVDHTHHRAILCLISKERMSSTGAPTHFVDALSPVALNIYLEDVTP